MSEEEIKEQIRARMGKFVEDLQVSRDEWALLAEEYEDKGDMLRSQMARDAIKQTEETIRKFKRK